MFVKHVLCSIDLPQAFHRWGGGSTQITPKIIIVINDDDADDDVNADDDAVVSRCRSIVSSSAKSNRYWYMS